MDGDTSGSTSPHAPDIGGFQVVDGVLLTQEVNIPLKEHVHNMKNMAMREDDIIIAAFPKCGTHWLWEVALMLVRGKAEHDPRTKEAVMLEFVEVDKVDAVPSPRVFNTHLLLKDIAQNDMVTKRPRIIHVIRNPKDVAVSTYFHIKQLKDNVADQLGLGIVDFCRSFLHGGPFKGTRMDYFAYMHEMFEWQQKHPEVPVINIYFEDIKKNPVQCVQQLAHFLNLDASDQLCKDIADQCSFHKLKQADDTLKEKGGHWERHFKEGVVNFYRKGEVGDWKNHFTVALSEEYDQMVLEGLKDLDLRLQYSI